MATSRKYDLYSSDFRETTHETYARMRDATIPSSGSPDSTARRRSGSSPATTTSSPCSSTTSASSLDPALAPSTPTSSSSAAASPLLDDERIEQSLLTMDGDDHRRLRRLVVEGVHAADGRAASSARSSRSPTSFSTRSRARGAMDLVDDYAFPLPIIVIAELLGIPVEDRDRFRDVVEHVRAPSADTASCRSSSACTRTSSSRTSTTCSRTSRRPERGPRERHWSRPRKHGDHLSENELYSMAVLLIVAGHETTVSLITNSVLALLTHPDAARRRARGPVAPAVRVEELLRFDSPVERAITRWATDDVELGGQHDRARRSRDRRDRLREPGPAIDSPTRTRSISRSEDVKHVGFGRGSHFCLGAPARPARGRDRAAHALRAAADAAARDRRGPTCTGGRSRSSAASPRCPWPGTTAA